MLVRATSKYYRILRVCFLENPGFLANLFFRALALAEATLFARRKSAKQTESDRVFKQLYLLRFGTAPLFKIITDKPVALDSDDYKWPRGTINDNSLNPRFNHKLYSYLGFRQLKMLDLGCAGGGLVRSAIEDGHTAIGIEGSDISRKLRAAEWDTIPHHLFTGDITSPLSICTVDGEPMRFDCITAWDVLEHIPTAALPVVAENVSKHLSEGGLAIFSIDSAPDGNPLTGAVYHHTLEPQSWWVNFFSSYGLAPVKKNPFETEDYVRGHGKGLKDWHPDDGHGFHLVLEKVNLS